MASTLPAELVEEILLRVPADEPAHLVRASVVCKAWRHILSDDSFRGRYRRFHGTPPLLGFIYKRYKDSNVQFVPTTCIAASPVHMPPFDRDGWTRSALDCRHGRVLLLIQQAMEDATLASDSRLIVWDPITGGQRKVRVPSYLHSPYNYIHAGAVLCAKDGCDHVNCHGGSFRVVLLGMSHDSNGAHTRANVYSSETGGWRGRTPNDITDQYIDDMRPNLLLGDALYFPTTFPGHDIVKYDFCKHELSLMDLEGKGCRPILIKGGDGGLGVAAILHNCIYMWSWKHDIKGVSEWVKYGVMVLDDTLLPKGVQPLDLLCMAEGTNHVFIGIACTGIFLLDLKTKQVRKIGETESYFHGLTLPFMC